MGIFDWTIEELWNKLKEITRPIWGPIVDLINYLRSHVSDWFCEIADRILNLGASIGYWVSQHFTSLITWITDKLDQLGSWISQGLTWIRDHLDQIGVQIALSAQGIPPTLSREMAPHLTEMSLTQQASVEELARKIGEYLREHSETLSLQQAQILGPLAGPVASVATVGMDVLDHVLPSLSYLKEWGEGRTPEERERLFSALMSHLMTSILGELPFQTDVGKRFQEEARRELSGTPKHPTDLIRFMIGLPGRLLYELLFWLFDPAGPPSLSQAKMVMGDFYTLALAINILSGFAEYVVSALSLSIEKGILQKAVNMFYWTTGLAWVAWVGLSPIFRHRVVEPIDKWFKEEFRTTEPTRAMLDDMWEAGVISDEEYGTWMGKLGYPDDVIDRWKSVVLLKTVKNVTREMLSAWYRADLIDEDMFRQMLHTLRYPPWAIENIIEYETLRKEREKKGETREATASMWSRWFRAGLVDESSYRHALEVLGYDPETTDLMVAYDKWRMETSTEEPEREATRSMIEAWYKADLIDDDEFRARLRDLKYPDDVIERELQYLKWLKSKATAPESREATREMWSAWFRYGVVTEEEYERALLDMGYSPEDVARIIAYDKLRLRKEPEPMFKKLSLTQIRDAYRRGLITKEEAVERIALLGYSDEDMELVAKLILTEPEEDYRELTRSLLAQAFHRGLIDADSFRERLIELGYSPEDAELIVLIEKSKQELSPEEVNIRIITPTQALNAWSRGVISVDDCVEILRKHNYPEDQIQILLGLECYDKLRDLRFPEDVIEVVLSNVEGRVRATEALWRFIRGYISETDLRSELEGAGYPSEVVDTLIEIVSGLRGG